MYKFVWMGNKIYFDILQSDVIQKYSLTFENSCGIRVKQWMNNINNSTKIRINIILR